MRLAADQENTFFCKPRASGRYVYIRNSHAIDRKVVVVCEVEVYSTYLNSKFFFNDCIVIVDIGAPRKTDV